ncbi:MAG: hypothetical protein PHY73_01085 [Candidatus Omnitrophica bacterium]|nr:hypothetical protein [Candidatus Omnitrophota bacterium]
MIYLLVGQSPSKENKISEIKTSVLTSKESLSFDYEILHGHKLNDEILKKSLISLPSVSKKRVVLLRQAHELNARAKKIILSCQKDCDKTVDLILDADEWSTKDSFLRTLGKAITVVNFEQKKKADVFEMTRAIISNRKIDALKLLTQLIEEGNHPLKIMAPIVWSWKNSRNRISKERFRRGLMMIQDADFCIKRSRLSSEYALEVLVVKLCS